MKPSLIIVIICCFFYCLLTNAQQSHEFDNFPFESVLTQSDNKRKIIQLVSEFDSTITHFQKNREKSPFNFNDKWKLTYYIHTGWEERYVPNSPYHTDINDIYTTKNICILTGDEIFAAFDITDSLKRPSTYYEQSKNVINTNLQIPGSYRGYWTPILSNNNKLIIFSGHYYPNGNASSWLRNYYYFFEKVE